MSSRPPSVMHSGGRHKDPAWAPAMHHAGQASCGAPELGRAQDSELLLKGLVLVLARRLKFARTEAAAARKTHKPVTSPSSQESQHHLVQGSKHASSQLWRQRQRAAPACALVFLLAHSQQHLGARCRGAR